MVMINGFAKSGSLFLKNGRVKTLTLSLLYGFNAPGMVSENDYYLYLLKEYIHPDEIEVPDNVEPYLIEFPFSNEDQKALMISAWKEFNKDYEDLATMIIESVFDGDTAPEDLTDEDISLVYQIHGFIGVRMYISDVYPGTKYSDTCISELTFSFE